MTGAFIAIDGTIAPYAGNWSLIVALQFMLIGIAINTYSRCD
jgi:hypothetical protein